ncbi:hypothetical protein OsccyDRAFT_3998 [Leptolyngbyaceae cyanobacterium JSC-12]|nr:hypothetical protein OsccyDRAFT_3998 [Leptolyngbyaceae cyanobacterium JSC-12]
MNVPQKPGSRNPLFTLLVIGLFTAILLPASQSPNLFTLKPFGWSDVIQLLTFLLLISLFLERALEVFITPWRRDIDENLDNQVKHSERRITEIKEQIETENKQLETLIRLEEISSRDRKDIIAQFNPAQTIGDTNELNTQLHQEMERSKDLRLKRALYKSETRRIALWLALFIGLLISGVGIRALETLVTIQEFDQEPMFYNGQIFIFRSLDTLLTGGLIAGGSDGIHKLVRVFTTFLEETQTRIKNSLV